MSEDRAPYETSTRCVHCSGGEAAHAEPGAKCKKFDTLNLPDGKTCGDCVHIRRCEAIFGHIPADRTCDWFPIRFHPAPAAPAVQS